MQPLTKELISGWLTDMGLSPAPLPDPNSKWRFSVNIPPQQTQNRLEVFAVNQMPRAVFVGANTVLSPEHTKTLSALDTDAKREFLNTLSSVLNKEFVEYQLTNDPVTGDLTGFQVTAIRYDDGLTLDSFARTVSSVFKAQLAAIQCVQLFLGAAPPQGGGEFDFRKLSIQ